MKTVIKNKTVDFKIVKDFKNDRVDNTVFFDEKERWFIPLGLGVPM